MTAKHTPGKWTIHNNIGKKSELGIIADKAPCIIAIMGNQKAYPIEAQANARLIASAPSLLEFIRDMVNEPERLEGDELEKTLFEAKELIEKIEG